MHLFVKGRVDSGKLHANHTASDNGYGCEIFFQVQGRGRIQHVLPVYARYGQFKDPGTGSNDDMVSLNRGAVKPLCHQKFLFPLEGSSSPDQPDIIGL